MVAIRQKNKLTCFSVRTVMLLYNQYVIKCSWPIALYKKKSMLGFC